MVAALVAAKRDIHLKRVTVNVKLLCKIKQCHTETFVFVTIHVKYHSEDVLRCYIVTNYF